MFFSYSRSFYRDIHEAALTSAREIVPLILTMTGARSVVDVGCGEGAWLSVFKENGAATILGLDGSHVRRDRLMISPDAFRAVNLENPPHLADRFDLAVSLEVAEHLDPAKADAFVAFLTSVAPVVMFSAAIPLQDGTHHVNEQWPSYWVDRFRQHGCAVADVIRPAVWNSANVAPWYRQNILLFVRHDALATHPALAEAVGRTDERSLSRVHPEIYLRVHERPMGSAWTLLTWLPRLVALRILRAITGT